MAEDKDRLAMFVQAFTASFGHRAMDVAEAQLGCAADEAKLAWQQIVGSVAAEQKLPSPD